MAHEVIVQGDTLESIREIVLSKYGTGARIIAAEKITQGGISGFFAKKYIEATVTVPDTSRPAGTAQIGLSGRLGIAALLADADTAEDSFHATPAEPSFSTASNDFDALITDLAARNVDVTANRPAQQSVDESPIARPAPRPQAIPTITSQPGDLVLIIGLSPDALSVATSMSKHLGVCDVRGAGTAKARGAESIADRRSALLARATAVTKNKSVICAFGLDPAADAGDVLEAINADQIWVAVDAGRKAEDTARWLDAVEARVRIDAIAVVNTALTSTPQTVRTLGYPIGWSDGAPAAPTQL